MVVEVLVAIRAVSSASCFCNGAIAKIDYRSLSTYASRNRLQCTVTWAKIIYGLSSCAGTHRITKGELIYGKIELFHYKMCLTTTWEEKNV